MLRGTFSEIIPSLTGILKPSAQLTEVIFKTNSLTGTISKDASLHYYDDGYIFTPSQEEQVIPMANKFVSRDIVINPIPSIYGLISWNGSYLTVS